MEKRKIAENISVSRIGMGCWSFGGGAYWGEQSQKDTETIVNQALDLGINFFDTARMYNDGESEKSLGLALENRRKEAVICSKVSPARAYYKTLKEECEISLKNLKTDFIDIYMLHWPINDYGVKHFTEDPQIIANPPQAEEAFKALVDLKKEGKIRSIGISNYGAKQTKEILSLNVSSDADFNICANEMTYNIISRAIEAEILPFCKQNNIKMITSMALMQGILTGTYNKIEDIPPHQAHSRHFKNERGGGTSRHNEDGAEPEINEVMRVLRELAPKLDISVAQLSIAWVLANSDIDCSLVGSRNNAELQSNIKAAEFKLPKEIYEQINNVSLPVLQKLGNNADYYENTKNSRIY